MKSKRRIEDIVGVVIVGLIGLLILVAILAIPAAIGIIILACVYSDINLSKEAWMVILSLIGLVLVYLGKR